jgi:hypothetical protein
MTNTIPSVGAGTDSAWHLLSATEAAERLQGDPLTGLRADEGERRSTLTGVCSAPHSATATHESRGPRATERSPSAMTQRALPARP